MKFGDRVKDTLGQGIVGTVVSYDGYVATVKSDRTGTVYHFASTSLEKLVSASPLDPRLCKKYPITTSV